MFTVNKIRKILNRVFGNSKHNRNIPIKAKKKSIWNYWCSTQTSYDSITGMWLWPSCKPPVIINLNSSLIMFTYLNWLKIMCMSNNPLFFYKGLQLGVLQNCKRLKLENTWCLGCSVEDGGGDKETFNYLIFRELFILYCLEYVGAWLLMGVGFELMFSWVMRITGLATDNNKINYFLRIQLWGWR